YAVFCCKFFFRKLGAVEIRYLARAYNVELQHFEICLHVVGDPGLREIDEVRLLAIGTASQLPHDHKALTLFARALEIITEIEKALQEPRLFVEPIIGQNRLLGPRACGRQRNERRGTQQQTTSSNHDD